MAGCSKAPVTPGVYQTEQQACAPTPSSSPDFALTQAPTPEPVSTQVQTQSTQSSELSFSFSNPAANTAWNQYVDSFESVRSVPPPPASELGDPGAISAHIEEINRRLGILQQARAALMSNLTSPEDKKRFRAAEQSLSESSE